MGSPGSPTAQVTLAYVPPDGQAEGDAGEYLGAECRLEPRREEVAEGGGTQVFIPFSYVWPTQLDSGGRGVQFPDPGLGMYLSYDDAAELARRIARLLPGASLLVGDVV